MCIWTHAQTLHLCHARLSSYLIFDMTSRTSSCSFFYFLLLGLVPLILVFFFFKNTAPPEISPLPLPDPLPISRARPIPCSEPAPVIKATPPSRRNGTSILYLSSSCTHRLPGGGPCPPRRQSLRSQSRV